MKNFLLLLVAALLALPAQAQSLGGFFRSITNSLSGSREVERQTSTSTIGVRGLDDGKVAAAAPAPDDLKLLESWSATRIEAENGARKRGLVAHTASYGAAPGEAK